MDSGESIFRHGDRVRIIGRDAPYDTGVVVEDWETTPERRAEHHRLGWTVVVREDERLRTLGLNQAHFAYAPERLELLDKSDSGR